MAFTKAQILNFLNNKKLDAPHVPASPAESSLRYYWIGCMRILVQKDAITLAELQAEFPELA